MSSKIAVSIIIIGLVMLTYELIVMRFGGTTENRHKYSGMYIRAVATRKTADYNRNMLRPLHPV